MSIYGLKFLERAFICMLEEVAFAGDPTSLAGDNILSRATCEGGLQIRWCEDSIMGMGKGGASNLAGYTT